MNSAFALFVLALAVSLRGVATRPSLFDSHQNPLIIKPPVPVELFVMSKCPDAVLCEGLFREVRKYILF